MLESSCHCLHSESLRIHLKIIAKPLLKNVCTSDLRESVAPDRANAHKAPANATNIPPIVVLLEMGPLRRS